MPRRALVLAFLSGLAGLVYEVLWAKELAVLIGSSALAQTVVLVVFLGGLAAGSAALGSRADRASSPWTFYSRLEWAIAAMAVLSPLAVRAVDLPGLRWLSPVLVFAPAFVMGGTIPALCRAVGGDPQLTVGRVYFANSAGAVVGAILADFLLVPFLGYDGAFLAASLINAIVGILAVRSAFLAPAAGAASSSARRGPSTLPATAIYLTVFLSGFIALSYEIAWTRLLALVMGSSVYSFGEMLAGFIAGVSLGSFAVSGPRARRRDPLLLLGLAELGAGVSVLATMPLYDRLTFFFMLLRAPFGHSAAGFYGLEAAKFLFCAALMLLPMMCLGAALPLAVQLAEEGESVRGSGVGAVFAWNTAGNVLGAGFGYWILPWLGVEGLLRSGTTVHAVVGAGLLWFALPRPEGRRSAALGALASGIVVLRFLIPPWDRVVLAQGLYRSRIMNPPTRFSAYKAHFNGISIPFYRDDREATVSVGAFVDGELVLKVNGKSDASNGEDMRTQILLGEVPMLLKPDAKRALVVGWGAGITAGSVLRHPVQSVDAVELIPSVVAASQFFKNENGGALYDPRLRLRVEDAKTFLRDERPPYDVIVSEPSNPWMAGVGALFTREFYERASSRLAPGGVMVQWFHVYEMDDRLFSLVLRTYRSVFPHVTLWNVVDADVLIVGSREPLSPDFAAMERAFAVPAVWADVRRAGMAKLTTLLALQSAGESSVDAMAGAGPLNRDRRPLLEYGAPRAFFRADRVRSITEHDDRGADETSRDLLLTRYLKARGRPMEEHEFMDRIIFPHSVFEEKVLRNLIAHWKRLYPRDSKAELALYWVEDYKKHDEAARAALERAIGLEASERSRPAKSVIIGKP